MPYKNMFSVELYWLPCMNILKSWLPVWSWLSSRSLVSGHLASPADTLLSPASNNNGISAAKPGHLFAGATGKICTWQHGYFKVNKLFVKNYQAWLLSNIHHARVGQCIQKVHPTISLSWRCHRKCQAFESLTDWSMFDIYHIWPQRTL